MTNDTQELPATDSSKPDPDPQQPTQLPIHAQAAIDAHQKGMGLKLMWVHPQLANDIAKAYGAQGLAAIHDPKLHGDLDSFTGDKMAIDPANVNQLPPTPSEPDKPGAKVLINDQPTQELPTAGGDRPDPSVEINDQPGKEKAPAEPNPDLMVKSGAAGLVGPGVRFDGKQYLYWDGSTWKPANIGPLKSQANTPPGLA